MADAPTPTRRRPRARLAPALPPSALLLLLSAGSVAGQLPAPDALQIAAGGDLSTSTATLASNPAGLAAAEGWQLVISPLRLGLGLSPITGADIARAGDGAVPRARREAWLARLDGRDQRGAVDLSLGPVALRRGNLALSIATTVVGATRLPADAVELILFGNAGRTGEPRDLRLTGASIDGAAFTTMGIAWGTRATAQLALGARLHASLGHGVVLTRDAGSVLTADDAAVELRLPTVTSTGATPGSGLGLDLGATWRTAGTITGVSLHNAASSFSWSASDLRYREGETLIEGSGVEADFDARPLAEAPPALRALLRRVRPARRLELEHVRPMAEGLHLRLTLRERLERGLAPGAPNARLVGIEWQVVESVTLATHTGAVEGDWRGGLGIAAALGAWGVSAAWLLDRGDDRRGSTLAMSLNWSGR